MQSLFYLVLAIQLLASAHPQDPVDPKAQAPTSFLTFDPSYVTFDPDSTEGAHVGVSLSEKPTGPVSVYLEAPNLIFSTCKLSFTTKNWDKEQTFKVSPVPYLPKAPANSEIKVKFCYHGEKDKDPHKPCQEYRVTQGKDNGSFCLAYASGVHYRTFGELIVGALGGLGTTYAVKSDSITIQSTTGITLYPTTPVQTKIALRYYKTIYVFDLQVKKAQLMSDNSDGVSVTELPDTPDSKVSRVVLSDGSTLTVTYYFKPLPHIKTVITLGRSYKGRISGLCGDFDTKSFTMPNGQIAADAKQLSEAWKVPQEDNLALLGKRATCVAQSKTVKIVKESDCKIPNLNGKNNE